jgi:hypothetical protein
MPIFAPNKLQRDAKLRLERDIDYNHICLLWPSGLLRFNTFFSELTKQTVDEHQGISNMCGKFQQKMQRAGNL